MRPINNLVNNLVYCASAARDVDTVIVDGQILVRNGQLLAWDERRVLAEAEETMRQRFAQAGLEVPAFHGQP